MTVASPFANLPVAPSASRDPSARRDPSTLLFIGYGPNGRLKTLPDSPFIQIGFTSGKLVMGKTPSGADAHCIICSANIPDAMTRQTFRNTISKLIALNQERSRGTSDVTDEQMATFFANIMAQFGFTIEQFRPLESPEDVRAQIDARSGGRTRTATPAYAGDFDFTKPPTA